MATRKKTSTRSAAAPLRERRRAPPRRSPAARSGGGRQLVIVESPAKAKTINRYLGPDFLVQASVGHIRDLPTKAEKGSKEPVPGVNLETTSIRPTSSRPTSRRPSRRFARPAARQARSGSRPTLIAKARRSRGTLPRCSASIPAPRSGSSSTRSPRRRSSGPSTIPTRSTSTRSTRSRPDGSSIASSATRSRRCCGRRSPAASPPAACSRWRCGSSSSENARSPSSCPTNRGGSPRGSRRPDTAPSLASPFAKLLARVDDRGRGVSVKERTAVARRACGDRSGSRRARRHAVRARLHQGLDPRSLRRRGAGRRTRRPAKRPRRSGLESRRQGSRRDAYRRSRANSIPPPGTPSRAIETKPTSGRTPPPFITSTLQMAASSELSLRHRPHDADRPAALRGRQGRRRGRGRPHHLHANRLDAPRARSDRRGAGVHRRGVRRRSTCPTSRDPSARATRMRRRPTRRSDRPTSRARPNRSAARSPRSSSSSTASSGAASSPAR